MLSKTVEFNVGVLVAHGGPNGKTTAFPLITCRNESVEIAGRRCRRWQYREEQSRCELIIVKNPGRGRR